MNQVPKVKIKGYALVFNQANMPLIDKPKTVPEEVWKQLTIEQQQYANAQCHESLRRIL